MYPAVRPSAPTVGKYLEAPTHPGVWVRAFKKTGTVLGTQIWHVHNFGTQGETAGTYTEVGCIYAFVGPVPPPPTPKTAELLLDEVKFIIGHKSKYEDMVIAISALLGVE